MFIVYGIRTYGHVLGCGGEYVATRFFHLYYLPLIPLGSMWVTREESHWDSVASGTLHGLRLSPNLLSILTAYLRIWGVLCGIVLFVGGEQLLGGAFLGAFVLSWLWRLATPRQRERQRLFANALGFRCNPDILPRKVALALMGSTLQRWKALYGEESPERIPSSADDPDKEALRYALLRLHARVSGGKEARELAEAIFLRNQTQVRQVRAEMDKYTTVLEGSLKAFDELEARPEGQVLVAWYQPEQWSRFREISTDAEKLPPTHAQWLAKATAASKTLSAAGRRLKRVEVDVDDLIAFASRHDLDVERKCRTKFLLAAATKERKPRVEAA